MATPTETADTLDAVLAEQGLQIAAAKTLDSDLDYAFNLQMQEAISASLSLSPSPSPSTSQSPNLTTFLQDDDVFDYTALLIADIEKSEQERRDREASELLMNEMRIDIDRRIHDQNLAREIMNIPDSDWEIYGDNYHKPYDNNCNNNNNDKDEGCSSSSSKTASFKVYCKGMGSEERVRDTKVIVGGIGVAICDEMDNLIFEVSKVMEVVGGGKSTGEEAEIKGLIEGLNVALGLDLKRVVLFCDDFMIYQYVLRRVEPKQSKISTLLNQFFLLAKKFRECKAELVARNDIKFAFKLARGAILSQIMWPEETRDGKKSMKETCIICFEDTDVGQMFSVDGCLHRFCFSCMKQHVEVKLLNGMEAKCPYEGCKSEVSIHACGKFIDPKLVEIMSQRKKEAAIAVTEKIYCPVLRCSALMSKTEVLEYTKTSFVGAENSGARKCIKCQHFFCINCRVPWHYNINCNDYRRANPFPRTEDALLTNLANQKHWRRCMKCSHLVELAEGCYHITCRCGYEFCYTCGAEWKNKKPTCRCPIWDERNIVCDGQRR